MNALQAIFMSDHRRSFHGAYLMGALFIGTAALSATYAFSVVPAQTHAEAGASVHAKNGETPGWILDLQTRNAGQSPLTIEAEEPSFWI